MSSSRGGADLYSGSVLINFAQSTAAASGVVPWAIRNSGSQRICISRLYLKAFFDGVAAATLMRYQVRKATGVTAFSGGTALTPMHDLTSDSGVTGYEIRVLDTGLTLTGATYGEPGAELSMSRVDASSTVFEERIIDINRPKLREIELAANECLVIRLADVAVIGDSVKGFCEFSVKA